MRCLQTAIFISFLAITNVFASTNLLKDASAGVAEEISSATQELNTLRDEISTQKRPLAGEMERLKEEVRALREKTTRERTVRNMRADHLEGLRKEIQTLERDFQFIHTVLVEYRRSMETCAGAAEAQTLAPDLKEIDLYFPAEESPTATADGGERVLKLAKSWIEAGFRVRKTAGVCLDTRGQEHSGDFVIIGPLEYFSSPEATGLVIVRAGSSVPSVFEDLPDADIEAIAEFINTGDSNLPVDVSSGNALKARKARKSLGAHIKAGGFTMYPLLAIGLLALILSIAKLISLFTICTSASGEISRIASELKSGHTDEALSIVEGLGKPLRSIIMAGVNHCNASSEHCEEIMHERVLTTIPTLQRYLGAIAVFGAVSPLLGLLGTVTGMIHVFQRVTIFGTGDPRMLSGGISEALVTTVTGLTIAIPVLLVHAYLSRKASSMIGELEHSVVEFIHYLHSRNGDFKDDHTHTID